MKKLMIAAAIVCAAAVSQAASVVWASGAMNTAASASGGWSGTTVAAASAEVLMSVYMVDATTYGKLAAKTSQEIYDWAQTKTADYTASSKPADTYTAAATVSVADTFASSTHYYSIITAEYTDATYGDMFMTKAYDFTTGTTGGNSKGNIFGGAAAAGGVRNWQAVPEPTSGLLLLLGVAGLALRRRRA